MIAVDTNILVRLLVNDDKKQAKFAANLFKNNSIFIPKSVLLETEWVLRYTYEIKSDMISTAFEKLLGLSRVRVEDSICVSQAIQWYKKNFDFADALHLAASMQATTFATFDKKFIKIAKKSQINLLDANKQTE